MSSCASTVPLKGQRVLLKTQGLPGNESHDIVYSFSIDRTGNLIVIHVPGHHRGPDNCTPENPEQEIFLDSKSLLMRRSWGCQWDVHGEVALEEVITLLRPLVCSYHVVLDQSSEGIS